MKSPAFQFYPSDFLTGTAHFKPEEVGAYIRLLCYQWEHGGIDEQDFETFTGLADEKQGRVKKKFSKGEDGLYRNIRLEETRVKQKKFSELQSNRAKKQSRKQAETEPDESRIEAGLKPARGEPFKKTEDRSMKIEDEEGKKEGGVGETTTDDALGWLDEIRKGNDHVFEKMLYNENIEPPTSEEVMSFKSVLCQYPSKRIKSQHYLRVAFMGEIVKNRKKYKNGTVKGRYSKTDGTEFSEEGFGTLPGGRTN